LTFGWQAGTSNDIGSQWAGYTYSWHIKARNGSLESGWSETRTFTVRPGAPSNLSATTASCSQINLSWSDNSGNEEGYKVYRNGSLIATLGSGVTSYQSTGLSGNTNYPYAVNAYRGSIESNPSNSANATTQTCSTPPATPTGVSASDGAYTDKVSVLWTAPSGATSYQVHRNSSNSLSGAALIGSPLASAFDDTSAAAGSSYWYFVKACNAAGCSGFSSGDSGYRAAAAPTDDNYEENDTLATAYDLSDWERTWLSSIKGYGIQSDSDFYRIYVTPGDARIIIDVRFTHSQGDIDVEVYDSAGNFLTGSNSVSDNEYIDYSVPLSGAYYYLKVFFGNNGNQYDLWWDDISPTSTSRGMDTTGVFRPSNGLLYLKHANSSGYADLSINYGTGGDYPVTGDWDGNGTDTIGIYRNGIFYLRNSNTLGFADLAFAFGTPGDQPVAGDWDGDGVDSIGVYRNGVFLLRNSNSAGAPDTSFALGNPSDVGIAGDWNGDGLDSTGVFRPSNGVIFLKNANTSGFADIALNYGLSGDRPVVGDWNNDGMDTIGVYRNATFFLRNSNTNGFAEIIFSLGNTGDMPIAGNWDGSNP
jgi:hypothetical protein